MVEQIRLLSAVIGERKYALGRDAALSGQSRDSHGMNPGSPRIADFHAGYDSVARLSNHSAPLKRRRVDVAQPSAFQPQIQGA